MRSKAIAGPTTEVKRGSRISRFTSRLPRFDLAHRPAAQIPVVGRDILEHDPDRVPGQLRQFGYCVDDAPCHLVLALLGMAFEDLDIHKRHGGSSLRPAHRCERRTMHGITLLRYAGLLAALFAIGFSATEDRVPFGARRGFPS